MTNIVVITNGGSQLTSNQVQVSIYCLAFNHEKYIRRCLDGFLMQKEVTFEIIIHDDASTDKTANIIREYEEKYPNIFKPIYQTKNHKYFPNVDYGMKYIVPVVRGKYIAMCDGDDYWTDPHKLKKQYDALEKNPDCYLCLHDVEIVDEKGLSKKKHYPLCAIPTGKLLSDDFFNIYEKAGYYQTSSYFFSTEKYIEYKYKSPEFKRVAPVHDRPLLLYFSYVGNVYYINETMSNYRFLSQGSWSSRIYEGEQGADLFAMRKNHITQSRKMLQAFSVFSNGKYDGKLMFEHDAADRREFQLKIDMIRYCNKRKNYKLLFREFSVKELLGHGFLYKVFIEIMKKVCHIFCFRNRSN